MFRMQVIVSEHQDRIKICTLAKMRQKTTKVKHLHHKMMLQQSLWQASSWGNSPQSFNTIELLKAQILHTTASWVREATV